jgi:hypothetical protein
MLIGICCNGFGLKSFKPEFWQWLTERLKARAWLVDGLDFVLILDVLGCVNFVMPGVV